MKFTTPCFVRVEDAENRKELAEWLSSIGRYVSPAVISNDDYKGWVIVAEPYDADLNGYVGIWAKPPKSPAFIGCGDDVELFKALAAMNDENDREQWFISDTYANIGCVMWHLCDDTKFKHYYVEWENGNTDIRNNFRKATAEEIVEHFKEK